MALITKEQRELEMKDRAAVEEEFKAMEIDIKQELIKNLSIRDRLMRRLRHSRIPSFFKDDLGEFKIETRMLTGEERESAIDLNRALIEAGNDLLKTRETMKKIREFLATVSVTPIDWLDTQLSEDVIMIVFLNTIARTTRSLMEEIDKFRAE